MSARKPPHHRLTEPRGWFAIFFGKRGWIALVAVVVMLAATLIASVTYRTAAEFERYGTWADATVIHKRIIRDDDGDTYKLKFSFTPAGRSRQDVEHRVGSSVYNATEVGSIRPIRYLPSRPKKTELEAGDTYNSAWWAQGVALVAGVAGLVALWIVGSGTNRAVKARRHGVLQLATVERFVEDKNSGVPTGRGYMIWRLEDGKRGESLNRNISELRRIGTGSKINVYVQGETSVWEGDVGPRPERKSPFLTTKP